MLQSCLFVGLVVMFVAVYAEMDTETDKLVREYAKKEKNEITAKVIGSELEKGMVLDEDDDEVKYALKWDAEGGSEPKVLRIDPDGEVYELVYKVDSRRKRSWRTAIRTGGRWAWQGVKEVVKSAAVQEGVDAVRNGVRNGYNRVKEWWKG